MPLSKAIPLAGGVLLVDAVTSAIAGGFRLAPYGRAELGPRTHQALATASIVLALGLLPRLVCAVGLLKRRHWAVTLGKVIAVLGACLSLFQVVLFYIGRMQMSAPYGLVFWLAFASVLWADAEHMSSVRARIQVIGMLAMGLTVVHALWLTTRVYGMQAW